MSLDDGSTNGQPQPRPRKTLRPGGASLLETIEDPLEVGLGDRLARVPYREHRAAWELSRSPHDHLHRPARRGELHGIGHQVVDHLGQTIGVGQKLDLGGHRR